MMSPPRLTWRKIPNITLSPEVGYVTRTDKLVSRAVRDGAGRRGGGGGEEGGYGDFGFGVLFEFISLTHEA